MGRGSIVYVAQVFVGMIKPWFENGCTASKLHLSGKGYDQSKFHICRGKSNLSSS